MTIHVLQRIVKMIVDYCLLLVYLGGHRSLMFLPKLLVFCVGIYVFLHHATRSLFFICLNEHGISIL
jgi:hypothetical protein